MESRVTAEFVSSFSLEKWLISGDPFEVGGWTQWGRLRTVYQRGGACPCLENRGPAGWCCESVSSAQLLEHLLCRQDWGLLVDAEHIQPYVGSILYLAKEGLILGDAAHLVPLHLCSLHTSYPVAQSFWTICSFSTWLYSLTPGSLHIQSFLFWKSFLFSPDLGSFLIILQVST